jgi:hypothetical protein
VPVFKAVGLGLLQTGLQVGRSDLPREYEQPPLGFTPVGQGLTTTNDGFNRFEGRRTGPASGTSASRPPGFDLGYKASGLASVKRCGLGGVGLLNWFVPRPVSSRGGSF